jgi:hypothetical protein
MAIDSSNPLEGVAETKDLGYPPRQAPGEGASDQKPAPKAARPIVPESPHDHVSITHDDAHGVCYQVIDDRSGEVVTQIPSEQVLKVSRQIQRLLESNKTGKNHVDLKG